MGCAFRLHARRCLVTTPSRMSRPLIDAAAVVPSRAAASPPNRWAGVWRRYSGNTYRRTPVLPQVVLGPLTHHRRAS